jgi:hypothetical protein
LDGWGKLMMISIMGKLLIDGPLQCAGGSRAADKTSFAAGKIHPQPAMDLEIRRENELTKPSREVTISV